VEIAMSESMHDKAAHEVTIVQRSDAASFNGLFIASFVVFLLIAVCAQAITLPWRTWLPGAEGSKSLVGGVRSSVYTFMSYLN
jgi:light-harvesting complex 1 beta chain